MTKNVVKTFPWLCAALLIMLVPGLAGAQDLLALGDAAAGGSDISGDGNVLWDQAQACGGGGPASQQFPDFGNSVIQSADDFEVPDGVEWMLSGVVAAGTFFNSPTPGPLDDVRVQVWSDAGGLPDMLLCDETGANLLAPGPDMSLALSACAGPWPPGIYWVSVMGVMPFVPSGQVAWVPNDSNNLAEFAFQDPDGLTGNPCVTWGSGITTCGIGAAFPDLCFILEGEELMDEPVVAIPTLGQVGLVLLLLSLLGAGIYRLRKR